MTPEEQARQNIDRQLEDCGWVLQKMANMNIMAGSGVAVREYQLTTGEADYGLYIDGKVAGVIEAKKEGSTPTGVETQTDKYGKGLPNGVPHYGLPLPFGYESTGVVTRFTNRLNPHPRSREVFTFHRPVELKRLLEIGGENQLRSRLQMMPELEDAKLWPIQCVAIKNLEKSLSENRPRSLIQMTMGSGKTFTAVSAVYRLIKFGGASRILFLVDRNNLGKQTDKEFQQYASPYNNYKFTEEYPVQRLTKNAIGDSSKVVITTIQRLFSMRKGEAEFDAQNEEGSFFEGDEMPGSTYRATMVKDKKAGYTTGKEKGSLFKKSAIPVAYTPAIPIDFIIIDECHRSIYNQWRQVLDYFDAFIIGLTATPTKQTLGFFNQNLVAEYDHKAAVADNVNVGFDVYTILTKITVQGAQLEKEPEFFVPHRDRRTKDKIYKELDTDVTYAPGDLDRDVVAEDQIRLIIKTFKDRLFTDIFPGRTEVPKTLIFAKTDLHADDIVKIVREEFGRGNEFCQKITSKSHKPDDLLQSFRNTYNPRIAVTVDMIATGTDVKPLECLIFMRNIKSWSYFEQMKGRGSRVIDANSLKSVTPDAACKTRFVIVDAVGLCKQDKNQSKPLDRQPTVSLERAFSPTKKEVGVVHPDLASTLGAKISRPAGNRSEGWHKDVEKQIDGQPVSHLISTLFDSVDADKNRELAASKFSVTPDQVTDTQLDEIEAEQVRTSLLPFHNPQLREILLRPEHQVIYKFTRDQLLTSSFDPEAKQRAETLVTSFRQFIEDNKDEIEAISILYSRPYAAGLRYSQIKDLARRLSIKPFHVDESQPQTLLKLWQAFGAVHPDKVDTNGKHCKHIVDLVALVRHAIDPDSPLRPVGMIVEERFTEWLSDQQSSGGEFTDEQMQWLVAIKDHIASSLMIEQDDFEYAPFNQFGGSPKCDLNRAPEPDEWAVIKTTAVQSMSYSDQEAKPLPNTFEPRPHIEVKQGDMLMTRKGPRKRCGVACYVRQTRHRLMVCDTVYRFRCVESRVRPEYLELALNSPPITAEIDRKKSGINESGLSLTHKKIGSVEIPVPSIDEQIETVQIVEEIISNIASIDAIIETNLIRKDRLRQSVLKSAFEGNLAAACLNGEMNG